MEKEKLKKIKNKVFALLVASTVFAHIMLLLNKHIDTRNYDEIKIPTGTYHFFDDIPSDALNIIYCLYFVYAVLMILGLVTLRDIFKRKAYE